MNRLAFISEVKKYWQKLTMQFCDAFLFCLWAQKVRINYYKRNNDYPRRYNYDDKTVSSVLNAFKKIELYSVRGGPYLRLIIFLARNKSNTYFLRVA